MKKTINILKNKEYEVLSPIFSIGNFSGTEEILGLKIVSVIAERENLYEKNNCPICGENSKTVLPRPNWNKLTKIN